MTACTDVDECFECKNQNGCGFCEDDKRCYQFGSFPSGCAALATCPPLCTPNQCGDKECGPYDGCSGYCGFCERDAYCDPTGKCAKFPNVAGLFLGGMFLGFVLIAVSLAGYSFYKRKAGEKGYLGLN